MSKMNDDEASRKERKNIRKKQRDLLEKMQDSREELEDLSSTALEEIRQDNNMLFMMTTHSREQFNDALNLKEIAKGLTSQTEKLTNMSRRHDFESWADAIKHTYENEEDHIFSWSDFGKDVGSLFLQAPKLRPMLGVINIEIKPRRTMIRKEKQEKAKEIRPEEQEETGEQTEATNTRIIHLFDYLRSEHKRKVIALSQSQSSAGSPIDANEQEATIDIIETLVDPSDRVQTIENFFDYAFLIKDKRVVQRLSSEGLPETVPVDNNLEVNEEDGNDVTGTSRKQLVLSLGMADLRNLAELLPRDLDCPLHRDDPLYAAKDAREQAEILAQRAEDEDRQKKRKRSSTSSISSPSPSPSQSQLQSRSKSRKENKKMAMSRVNDTETRKNKTRSSRQTQKKSVSKIQDDNTEDEEEEEEEEEEENADNEDAVSLSKLRKDTEQDEGVSTGKRAGSRLQKKGRT